MSLVSLLKKTGKNGFGSRSTAEEVSQGVDLSGKTILVTGCNSGLGFETARVLALRGAHVVGLARTADKAREALTQLNGNFTPLACELSDPKSIQACISALRSKGLLLDAIICNAGIMALPSLQKDYGYERQFFTNHMGHFLLVTGLLDRLSQDGRVVLLSSAAHKAAPKGGIDFENLKGEKYYRPWTAYGQSKFANLLFAKELARRFEGTKRTSYALHPGVIATHLWRSMNPLVRGAFRIFAPVFLKTVAQGAATQVYVTVTRDLGTPSGSYFADCNPISCRADAMEPSLASRLWEFSEKLKSDLL
jgi:NAD(P)-dependent dehydrogenase (short-subunit alcohol dehydrogenase family)